MNKPLKEMVFRNVGGIWRNVAGDSAILADVLGALELQIDDKCEFARFKNYDMNISIWYRRIGGKITITLWQLRTE